MGSVRVRSDNQLLFLDFRFRDQRCREQTALPDTQVNRKRLQKVLDRIEAEIAAGTFNYGQFFPNSRQAAKLEQSVAVAASVVNSALSPSSKTAPATPLFKDFAETWYAEKEVEWRRSHKTMVRRELDGSLIPEFGNREVGQISKADVLAFRAKLAKVTAKGKKTSLSAARINKMLNPLRQILNEAADRFDFRTPFANINLKISVEDVQRG